MPKPEPPRHAGNRFVRRFQLIEIEDRGDFLRGFLQLEEILHLVNVQLA